MMLWTLSKNLCESWFKVFTGEILRENFTLHWEISQEGKAAMVFSGSGIGMGSTPAWRFAARRQEGCFCKKRYILP